MIAILHRVEFFNYPDSSLSSITRLEGVSPCCVRSCEACCKRDHHRVLLVFTLGRRIAATRQREWPSSSLTLANAGAFFVAKDQHFFEEHGLEADLVQVTAVRWRWRRWRPTSGVLHVSATGSALGAMVSGSICLGRGNDQQADGYFYSCAEDSKTGGFEGKISRTEFGGGIWMFTMRPSIIGAQSERDKIQMRVIGDSPSWFRLSCRYYRRRRFGLCLAVCAAKWRTAFGRSRDT